MMKNLFLIISLSFIFQISNAAELNTQFSKSIDYMMMNMSRIDTAPGAVIAAPSKQRPDYFYHWVRDAALVTEASLDLYQTARLTSLQRQNLKKFFLDSVMFAQKTQQNSLLFAGLGEPKFFVDGRVYNGPWGRPQNDGPALRSISFTRILALAIQENWPELPELKKILYQAQLPANSVLKYDFEYTASHWRDLNFDLWEEVYGSHFYTLMAQRKALALGLRVAQSFSDPFAAVHYQQEYLKINQELNRFWDEKNDYIYATINSQSVKNKSIKSGLNKSQLDSAVILAILHSDFGDSQFGFKDDRVLSTFQKIIDSFSNLYVINQNANLAPALGRYPEDTYDGYQTNSRGNPWVLTTAAAAEFLYRTVMQLSQVSTIKINQYNQDFFNRTANMKDLPLGKIILRGSTEYKVLVKNLLNMADSYLSRVLYHANSDASLSEQMNRDNGYMQGAPNLSWSHASFITAKIYRDKAYSQNLIPRGIR